MKVKELAGYKATEFVKDGMILGLGSGSTVYYTFLKLGELIKNGLKIKGIPTSIKTEEIAKKVGIPLTTFEESPHIDLTIDGADEVDVNLNLIKGGGGALLREKIVAKASKKYIVVIDSSKTVEELGKKFPLPVEVFPFGWQMTKLNLENLGLKIEIKKIENKFFVTDNGNYIFHCTLCRNQNEQESQIDKDAYLAKLKELEWKINNIPGVIENGLFLDIADTVIVGDKTGCRIIEKKGEK